MIVFTCPHCGREMRVRDEAAGKSGKCKSCSETVTVPNASGANIVPKSRPPAVAPSPHEIQPVAPTPVQQPTVAVQVNVPEQSKWSNSLGIASLVLGILAFMISWIPLVGILGMPLSGLGLLLGIGGVLVAITRKFAGIGFPIAGTAVSGLALMIAISVTYATGEVLQATADAIDETVQELEKSTATNQVVVGDGQEQTLDKTVANQQKPAVEVDEWADASNAVQQGDVIVRVESAFIDLVSINDLFGDETKSKDKLLQFQLLIENAGDSKKIEYSGWAGSGFAFGNAASLEDDLGNRYKRIGFGASSKIKGQVSSESIYPDKSITDLLVFEVPIEKATFLKLELPAEAFDGEGVLRLKIPMEMVEKR